MKKTILPLLITLVTIFSFHPAEAASWVLIREYSATKLYIDTDSIRGGERGPREAWFDLEYKEPDCTLVTRPETKCLTAMYVFERYYVSNLFCRMATEMHFTDGTVYTAKSDCEPSRFYAITVSGDQWKALYPNPIPEYAPRLEPRSQPPPSTTIYQCNLNYPNGNHYEGDCLNNKENGKGVLVYYNGDRYEGAFVSGNLNGNGIYSWDTGDRYEGEWKNNKQNGQGIMTWVNGDRYEGNHIDGEENGKGVLTKRNGDRQEGEWVGGKLNGHCLYISIDGHRYEGNCLNGLQNGKGVYIWSSGNRYDGDFVDGIMTGKGIYTYGPNSSPRSGDRYEGDFINDRMTGKGIYTMSNGRRYEGDFVDGKGNGYVTEYAPDGSVVKKGQWKNGDFIK